MIIGRSGSDGLGCVFIVEQKGIEKGGCTARETTTKGARKSGFLYMHELRHLSTPIPPRKQEEKAAQKRQQAEAKKAYQKVNTIRTKTDCVKEMIVDIIPSFASDEEVQLLAASLKESGVEVNVLDSGEEQLKYLNWRRKVTREWEEEEECWVPCSQRVEDENWVLVRLGAGEMAKIVGESGLVPYHQNIKRRFDEKQVIYLIEGFESWCKRRNKRRGKEESESESSDSDAGKGKGKGKKPKAKGKGRTAKIEPTVDEVEDDMLELQIEGGGVRIHQSKNFKESVEWIGSFTDQISLVPELKWVYRCSRFPLYFSGP